VRSGRMRHLTGDRRLSQHPFLWSVAFLISVMLAGHASSELGNTLDQFNNNSRFVREFGFVFVQSAPTPCILNTLPKYSTAHAYGQGEKPSFNAIVLCTAKDARVIGRQTLEIYYPTNPSKVQRDYLVYFVQESTHGVIDGDALVGKLEAFITDSTMGTSTGRGAERSFRIYPGEVWHHILGAVP
jgi:hypothetical protein